MRAPLAPFGGLSWCCFQMGFAALMTLGHWNHYANPWLVALLVPVSGLVVGIPLSRRWGRTRVGNMCTLGWVAITAVVARQIPAPVGELTVLWPLTSATLAMGLMAMIGVWRWAWSVAAFVLVETMAWGIARGLPLSIGLEQLAVLTPLVGGALYRLLMGRARDRELLARREEAAAIERLGALASQAEARRDYRVRVLGQVGDLLERLERGGELTPTECREFRLVEASLRDAIRGRGLATPDMVSAARAARERGASVALLDDRRTDCGDAVCRTILGAARETLGKAGAGDTFVARLLPMGRRNVATVLLVSADGEGVRREFMMPPSGDPDEGAVERPPVTLNP